MRATIVIALAALSLAGCVPSSRELHAPVQRTIDERLGAPAASRAAPAASIDALLAQPLDATAAVRIALARNPRVLAAFDELDIAAGDVAAALGLGPLTIDAQLRFGSHNDIEIDAIQNLLGLVLAPDRRAAARAELAAVRATAAATSLRLAARVEIAFTDLVAAQQDLELRRTAFDAADAAATLRERMHAAGNATDLALARDRDAREQARIELGRAEAAAAARRSRLGALLGLSGARTDWTTTGALRELPDGAPVLDALEATAVTASLDLAAGRERREAAERRADSERLHSILPELGAGIAIADDGQQTTVGPALRIGIPLFDPRTGERARAGALVRRADHELAAQTIELRAAVHAARTAALATYEEARRLHDVVLPLRQTIVDATLKHSNAMDAAPFALILARRDLVEAGHQYLDALRRYWNAMAEVTALSRGVMLARILEEAP